MLAAAAVLTAAAAKAPAIPAYVAAAVASPLRAPADLARDPSQKPAEVLAFAGVKPGDRIADVWPLPPYSTALLSAVAGPKGHVYAIVPAKLFRDNPASEPRVRAMLAPFPNVTTLVQAFDQFATPEPLDVVWLGKIYHDVPNVSEMGPLDIPAMNRAIFRALKPGGVLIVIDHAMPAGSGYRDTEPDNTRRLHRIDPEVVKRDMRAAGFQLVAESPLLASADDDHARSSLSEAMRNRTDRFILKFRKPLH